jgi:protein TonB
MAPFALLTLLAAAQPVPAQPAPAQPAPAPDTAPLPPTAWPFRLFSQDDYPAAARRAREQGRVTYRIEIGPDGRVSGCAVRWSSGSASLDAATCRIVSRRARFAPSRDSAGRPVRDHRDGDVLWVLPWEGEGED